MKDESATIVLFLGVVIFGTLFIGGLVGNNLFEPSIIERGRNEGIIFCTEKPKECQVEYTYLKLKETQK